MWLIRAVRFNVGLKAIALITSVVAWCGVVYAENPPVTVVVTKVIAQQNALIPSPFVLIKSFPALSLTVTGSRANMNAFSPADITVTVDYDAISATGIAPLPITLENTDTHVELVDPPTTIIADVDRLQSVTLPIQVLEQGTPAVGYTAGTAVVTPKTVTVVAPAHEISQLRAVATISLASASTAIQADAPVVIEDHLGDTVQEVTVSPTTVAVTVPMTASQSTTVTVVVPPTYGALPYGFELTGIDVNPTTVTLTGPYALLQSVTSITTSPISLATLSGDTTVTVRIVTPTGVTASPEYVVVHLSVTPIVAPPTAQPTPTPTPSASASPAG